MLPEERRGAIVSLLQENGRVKVKDLSRRFGTSEVTIRTDLKELHYRGFVFKSHGGAVLPTTMNREPTLQEKLDHAACSLYWPKQIISHNKFSNSRSKK